MRGEPDYRMFGEDIRNTIESGGSVIVPAFVLEITQKALYSMAVSHGRGLYTCVL